ncbi:hypothetical protein NIM88_03955 [Pseudomonas sp. GBPI_506]|uniref:hypothetical protein n=1 Tax=Pseudomonas sp. GBPI_506 TaxID=1735795 RepID=UPI0020CF567D|nr:hypothetical protein [Pseudomonas sp. GBPI_506]MCP9731541.1 hypothetical protein [Pseudomonas sp. GBPI_506]
MTATTFKNLVEALGTPVPKRKPAILPPVLANEPLPELVITGPINRVMELEGKRYAVEFVQALGASIRREPTRTKAIADLTRYAAAQPSSRASGVKIVIDMLKGA